MFLSSRKNDLECSSRISNPDFFPSWGSRIQWSKKHRIPDSDAQQWKLAYLYLMFRSFFVVCIIQGFFVNHLLIFCSFACYAICILSSCGLDNLAQRIGLASRYYIKNVQSNQQLVPEDLSSELQVTSNYWFFFSLSFPFDFFLFLSLFSLVITFLIFVIEMTIMVGNTFTIHYSSIGVQ